MSTATKGPSRGLGKGLGALLQTTEPSSEDIRGAIVSLKINDISPNSEQPRKSFDQEKLSDLAASIKENGIIQPIIVCRGATGYKIVAGERRWRAARLAGLSVIPAIIRELTDVEVLQQALIENIQRQDLNPLEEAAALDRLIQEHQMTQEKLARVVGRSRPAIANTLRLLHLPETIQSLVRTEQLTAGHARTLMALNEESQQVKTAKKIISHGLSVRETEKMVKRMLTPEPTREPSDSAYVLSIKEVEHRLAGKLGTRVKLKDRKGKGSIQISYYSNEDLDRILDLIDS
ncbi:MAG: ParB/RepB/Spo0J family partition protein [Clostridiaceae bacterium]|nr:ParB/RepB/Spo0J family partition protein [Clostridiaceae bacterium]